MKSPINLNQRILSAVLRHGKLYLLVFICLFWISSCRTIDSLREVFDPYKTSNCESYLDTSSLLVIPDSNNRQVELTGIIKNITDAPLYRVNIKVSCRTRAQDGSVDSDWGYLSVGQLSPGESRALEITSTFLYGESCTIEETICKAEKIEYQDFNDPNSQQDDTGINSLFDGEGNISLPLQGILVATCPSRLPFNCMPDEEECVETYTEEIRIDLGNRSFTYNFDQTFMDPIAFTESSFDGWVEGRGSGQVFDDGWMYGKTKIESDNWGTEMAAGYSSRNEAIIGKIEYSVSGLIVRICDYYLTDIPNTLPEHMKQHLLDTCDWVCSLTFQE